MSEEKVKKTIVIGHKNPDTDSICSAICYAKLKEKLTGGVYEPGLVGQGAFYRLRGLLYFTDGQGIYPVKRPPYDTAFVFVKDQYTDISVPAWAMKVILEPGQILETGRTPAAAQVLKSAALKNLPREKKENGEQP